MAELADSGIGRHGRILNQYCAFTVKVIYLTPVDSLCRDVVSMKACCNSRRISLLSAYIPLMYFFISYADRKGKTCSICQLIYSSSSRLNVEGKCHALNSFLAPTSYQGCRFESDRWTSSFENWTKQDLKPGKQKLVPLGYEGNAKKYVLMYLLKNLSNSLRRKEDFYLISNYCPSNYWIQFSQGIRNYYGLGLRHLPQPAANLCLHNKFLIYYSSSLNNY